MAITNVRTVQRIEVHPPADTSAANTANAKHETVTVIYNHTFDDSEDATLPVTTTTAAYLNKFVEDGGAATNYSSEDALVRTVCGAIWS